jgi:hypothetical protein
MELSGRPFQKGKSGNPNGRPKGARGKTTLAIETLLEGEANALTRKAIEMAKGGDTVALRLCLERILPPRKDRPVSFDLPSIERASDATKAHSALLAAVASGTVTPGEACEVAKLIEGFVRIVEVTEIEERLTALEQRTSQ